MRFRRIREYSHFLKSLFNTNIHLIWGMWKLTAVPHPAITIFGGARIPQDSPDTKTARELARMLANEGFSIITGGGPGIMEAANRGAIDFAEECNIEKKQCAQKIVSAGIGVIQLNLEKTNPYTQRYIELPYFFARKWLLVRYAVGFIIFPGGFGTMDELSEILTLIQTHKMNVAPIVLVGRSFWEPLMTWVNGQLLAHGLIGPDDVHLMSCVDTAQEALEIITMACRGQTRSITFNESEKK